MRVCFVVPVLAPYAKLRFAEMAKNKTIDLHIVIENDTLSDRTGWHFEDIEGCTTHLLSSYEHKFVNRHDSSGYQIDNSHLISKNLKKVINGIQPDVVLVCNSVQILQLCFHRTYRLGVVVEDTLRAAEGRKPINKLVKRIALHLADFYIPFSEDACAFLKENGVVKNIIRSSWSMNLDFFHDIAEADKTEMKRTLGISPVLRTYIVVSSLIPRKGLGTFLDAWRMQGESFFSDNELMILGDGPLEEALKNQAKDIPNVHFLGNRKYEDVSHFLQCSDVFVLPTLEDLCSLSVFEAMAAGLPVMTSIYNGARFLVHEGENGYTFDSECVESVADAISRMNQSDIGKMSQKSRQIIQNYSNEKVMGKLAVDLEQIRL